MTSDSALFLNTPADGQMPLYEAKLIHQFDHRFATYDRNGDIRDASLEEKSDPSFCAHPRYWVEEGEVLDRIAPRTREEQQGLDDGTLQLGNLRQRQRARAPQWFLAFRDITNATNERTAIFAFLPRAAVGNNAPLMLLSGIQPDRQFCLMANLNSLVFDFCARQKIGGTHLNFFLLEQLPVLPPEHYDSETATYVASRGFELVFTAKDIDPMAAALRHCDSPLAPMVPPRPFQWDVNRRALLRAELDAWFARAYGLNRKQLRYILDPADLTPRELENILDANEEVSDPLGPTGYAARAAASDFPSETFRVLKEREIAKFGEYRTRRLVLEAWERLNSARSKTPQVQGALN